MLSRYRYQGDFNLTWAPATAPRMEAFWPSLLNPLPAK